MPYNCSTTRRRKIFTFKIVEKEMVVSKTPALFAGVSAQITTSIIPLTHSIQDFLRFRAYDKDFYGLF
jgi:hypothetical protein